MLNILEGCDGEIEITRGQTEDETVLPVSAGGNTRNPIPPPTQPSPSKSKTEPPTSPQPNIVSTEIPNVVTSLAQSQTAVTVEASSSSGITVPYEQLKDLKDLSALPDVDPLNRELALSDAEFLSVFGMDKETFRMQPAWKRTNQKKAKGLF